MPSSSVSLTPVTVTVWVVSQLLGVNVSAVVDAVASPESDVATLMTTLEVGLVLRRTVNVDADPASVTVTELVDTVRPGESSSVVVALRVRLATLSYASSEDPSTTNTVIVVVWSPSLESSSIPVTVTVWAVSQFELVNVSAVGATVASPVSPDDVLMTTSLDGWVFSTRVNVSVDPASETVVAPPDAETVTPAESSSAVVTATARSPSAS